MGEIKVGYARVSTDEQDLTVQRDALAAMGVEPDRIYVDHGLTAATQTVQACGKHWPHAEVATPSW